MLAEEQIKHLACLGIKINRDWRARSRGYLQPLGGNYIILETFTVFRHWAEACSLLRDEPTKSLQVQVVQSTFYFLNDSTIAL